MSPTSTVENEAAEGTGKADACEELLRGVALALVERVMEEGELTREDVNRLKLEWTRKSGAARIPKNSELLRVIREDEETWERLQDPCYPLQALMDSLRIKATRTAAGVASVAVLRRPRVLIVPTGGEMVDAEAVGESGVEPGTIIESNSTVLGKLVEAHGGEYVRHDGVRDDADAIATVIREATAAYEAVLVIGGSSAGARDFTKTAIERAGG